MWWKLLHPNTSKPLFSDFVCVALHKRLKNHYCAIFWRIFSFCLLKKLSSYLRQAFPPPKQNVSRLLVCLSAPVSGMGAGTSLLQGRSCSFEPVLNVTLYRTICFMGSSSRGADCKGAEGGAAQGWGNKNKTNLLSFDLLGANLQML